MKDIAFLKSNLIANKGFYDNKKIYENTIQSINQAISHNYALHLSVGQTKDAVLIIYHDHDLTRLMNLKDRIDSVTYEELKFLCSYHIPTLEEALALIAGRVPIIINPREQNKKFFNRLIEQLDAYQGFFAIINSHARVIKWFNKNRPNYIVGEMLRKKRKFNLRDFIANYTIVTDFKSVNIATYDVHKIRNLKDQQLIIAYLIDDQEKYAIYKDVCDNLIIDNISELTVT